MNIEVIDNHSVAVDLLTKGTVLDAGARGFRFSKDLAWKGCHVVALEPDVEAGDANYINVTTRREAIWGGPGQKTFWLELCDDAEARRLVEIDEPSTGKRRAVTTAWSIDYFTMLHCKGGVWDLVKLNVEGSEYDILTRWPGPIARQIVVSFHEHTAARRGDEAIQKIVDHLSQWYSPVRHVKDERYCAGPNFWDSLFVLKELL